MGQHNAKLSSVNHKEKSEIMYKTLKISLILILLIPLHFLNVVAAGDIAVDPDPQRISDDVHYLASDELEGRLPGTRGCELAAEYIMGEFESAGLLPGVHWDGDYFQEFNITSGVEPGPDNNFVISTPDGSSIGIMDEDYLPLFFSTDGCVKRGGCVCWIWDNRRTVWMG